MHMCDWCVTQGIRTEERAKERARLAAEQKQADIIRVKQVFYAYQSIT